MASSAAKIQRDTLADTVATIQLPDWHKKALYTAVNKLTLPDDVKCKLASKVLDPPPPAGITKISAALAQNAISPGVSQELDSLKAVRVALWALVYFPGQVIQYHFFLRWVTGKKVQEDSDAVAAFRKNLRKIDHMIVMNGLRVVGLVKCRKTSQPNTVDGFRVSRDGDDYARNVARERKKRVHTALERYEEALSDDRILPGDVQNEAMRASITDEKTTVRQLNSSGTLRHFATELPQLPAASYETVDVGGDLDEDEDE